MFRGSPEGNVRAQRGGRAEEVPEQVEVDAVGQVVHPPAAGRRVADRPSHFVDRIVAKQVT